MRVVVTGSSRGIGYATARLFLDKGFEVIGIDVSTPRFQSYWKTYEANVAKKESLPEIEGVDILINNAGVQDDTRSIKVNLEGTINCTEKYGLHPGIKSIVNVCSASAHSGAEFPLYTASKGGQLAYTKWTALEVAKYGATCNSISPGGVLTDLNSHILSSDELYQKVLDETLLNKWANAHEIAEWIYFMSAVNRSMTGQDILVDNGEMAKQNFIW